MKKGKKKCPVCGEKLQPMYGKLMCPSCGYSIRPDSTNESFQNTTGQTSNMFNYNDDHMAGNTSYGNKKKGLQPISNKAMKSILISAGVLIFWGVIVFTVLRIFDDDKYSTNYSYDNNINFPTYSFSYDNSSNNGGSSSNGDSSTNKDDDTFSYPKSDLYLDLLEDIFEKNYYEITEEEVNSIVSIMIDRKSEEIKCGLSDGTMYSYHFFDVSYSTEDLNCFKGLQYIDADTELKASDISGLKRLKGVFSDNTFQDFKDIIPNPENIVSLGSYEDFFVKSLSGVNEFKNLEQLYVKSPYLSDISDLKNLTKLKYLCFENAGNVSDLTPITYLTNLEVLDITSEKIKNLSFLDNLDNIKEFSLYESKITDISALEKYKDTLTSLCLYENYDVSDYSVIGEFSGLTGLSICAASDAKLPDLSKNTRLEVLELERAYDLSMLSSVSNLSELYLKRCSLSDLPDLSHLNKLYYVRIEDSTSLITDLKPLVGLTSLTYLDISGTKVFGNVEELFDIPSLRGLYMDDCSVSIDFSKIQGFSSLEILSMNNITIKEYPVNEYGYTDTSMGIKIELNDNLDTLLKKFPSLTELYVAGDGITELDFISNVPLLYKLDISDNYISSLAPLKSLTGLGIVWCRDNTITDGYDLGERVIVISE